MEINDQSQSDKTTWNQIAESYMQDEGKSQDRNYQMLKAVMWECLGDVRDLHILDLGCGAGWLSKELADAGARAIGIDGPSTLLASARTLAPALTFLEADLVKGLPLKGITFDRIVAYMVLMDLPDLQQLVADVRLSLRPTGKFIFTLPHPCFFNYPTQGDEATGGRFKMISGYLEHEVWRIATWGGHNHYHHTNSPRPILSLARFGGVRDRAASRFLGLGTRYSGSQTKSEPKYHYSIGEDTYCCPVPLLKPS